VDLGKTGHRTEISESLRAESHLIFRFVSGAARLDNRSWGAIGEKVLGTDSFSATWEVEATAASISPNSILHVSKPILNDFRSINNPVEGFVGIWMKNSQGSVSQ
jgi:hypothetical protein